MSDASPTHFDYRHALQELIHDLVTTGWGEVVLGLTPTGEYEDPEFLRGLKHLIEEFHLEPTIEAHHDMVGFFSGFLPPVTEW